MTVTIGRRELLAALGGAAVWPLAARAQEAGRTYRLGFLLPTARQAPLPHPLAPTRQRRTVEHQRMLEKFLAAEVLEVRVLHPAIAQSLVGKVVGVLEDR